MCDLFEISSRQAVLILEMFLVLNCEPPDSFGNYTELNLNMRNMPLSL